MPGESRRGRGHRLSGLGLMTVVQRLREGATEWDLLARRLRLPASFVDRVRQSASTNRHSTELEFVQQILEEIDVQELMERLEKEGFEDLAHCLSLAQEGVGCQQYYPGEDVTCLSFMVDEPRQDFQVEALKSSTLEECLRPFCDDKKIRIENIKFRNANYTMATQVADVHPEEVLELKLSGVSEQFHNDGRKRKKNVYTVCNIMIQIGPHSKMFVRDPVGPEPPDSSSDDNDSVFGSGRESSLYDGGSSYLSPHMGSSPRPRPRASTQGSSVSLDRMSDVSALDDPVIYENKAVRSNIIPEQVMADARSNKFFWDLVTDQHIEAAHDKLLERFGDKDGRFIIWPYTRYCLVATVTYEGQLRHFQIISVKDQLTVAGSGIYAPWLGLLVEKIKYVPLPMKSGVGEVTLRSAVERVLPVLEEQCSYVDMNGWGDNTISVHHF